MKSWCEPYCSPRSFKAHIHGLLYGKDGATLSRYSYVVNIALHLPRLIPAGRVFIHHAVMSNLQEWIDLAASRPRRRLHRQPDSSLFSRTYLFFSRRFNLFTLTLGKQQINVTVLAISETCATSEAESASSDRPRVCAGCNVHTHRYAYGGIHYFGTWGTSRRFAPDLLIEDWKLVMS